VTTPRRAPWAVVGSLVLLGLLAAACGSGTPKASAHKSSRPRSTTSTTSTTTTNPTTTTGPAPTTTSSLPKKTALTVVPNIIGLKIAPARAALLANHLSIVYLNSACGNGSVASQSVVDALALPGPGPNVAVGATPLAPGTQIPVRTRIGIQWSGCFGGGTTVPNVVGLLFDAARQAVVRAGLTWTCQDQGTTTTIPHNKTVLSQNPPPGLPEEAGANVAFVMEKCPAAGP
jgi:hypothetical protein